MRIELFKTSCRQPFIGWVYVSLPEDPRIIGFTVRIFKRQLWVERTR